MSATPGRPPLTPLQQAFLALEEAESRLAIAEGRLREPIAIIGMGCRLPGAENPAALWQLLKNGVDAIGAVPGERFDLDAVYNADPDATGTTITREAGFLPSVDQFDPTFFGIARREAQGMDPQQRLLLEVTWEALESAGRAPDRLERSPTGVYVGVTSSDYANLQLRNEGAAHMDAHYASGVAHSVAAGRLSYVLGLHGPSVAVDTACSSSLVAVHLACQALRARDCDLALAGGVNLMLSPDLFVAFSQTRMLAPDGRCKTFDSRANGFGRGEGCAMVVLKRLTDAQADGDRILAVIRGTAINQDGPSSGLTAPNGPQQEAVIRDALARSGLTPGDVGYIEAHGTGTQLGDPLEMQALGTVFGTREHGRPVLVGSIKTNIGHVEAAAGVAGLLKLVLALQHREIPPHLHLETPSPHIDWGSLPIRVPVEATPWEPIGGRRIGGLSSFGFSGTNAHVIVEEAPGQKAVQPASDPQRTFVFVLSARDRDSLSRVARSYADAFAPLGDADLINVCYSAAVSKAEHAERATISARTMAELRERLAAIAEGREADGVRINRVVRRDPARIAFLFSGQGAQFAGMARSLYEGEPVFRAAFDRCAAIADRTLGVPLRDVVFGTGASPSPIDETGYSQPALFAVEYALTELWRSLGVVPDVVMGHSVGEIVAACVAGVMTLEDGVRLIVARAQLMQSLPSGGAMAAIHAPESVVAPAIAAHAATVSIAALNGPVQTVISGAASSIDAICGNLESKGIRCTRLRVSHAFHSPLVEPILGAFESAVRSIELAPPALRLISNVTGELASASQVTAPEYWRRHVREPVRFAASVETLNTLAADICIEVGPHATLLPLLDGTQRDGTTMVATLRKGRVDREQLAEALGALFLAGVPIDWHAAWRADGAALVDLPAYPYQRERLWFATKTPSRASRQSRRVGSGLIGSRVRSPVAEVVQYDTILDAGAISFARDHIVRGRTILPATGFIELALAAGADALGAPQAIIDLTIAEPLVFDESGVRETQVVVRHTDEPKSFEIHSWDEARDAWIRHAEGAYDPVASGASHESADAIRARCTEDVSGDAHYANLESRGLTFGPSLRGVERVFRRDGEALGEIALPSAAEAGAFVAHPALLDACIQVLSEAIPASVPSGTRYLPVAMGRVEAVRMLPSRVMSHVVVRDAGASGTMKADITILDDTGVVARIEGIALRAVRETGGLDDALYEIAWNAEPDASWIPAAATLSSEVGRAFSSLTSEHGLDDYHTAFLALESIAASWVGRALTQLGWKPAIGEVFTTAQLRAQLGVVPRYERLLARLLGILNEEGVVTSRGADWVVTGLPGMRDGAAEIAALEARHPSSRARFALASRTGPALDGVLRGTEDPLQLLFPQGSTDLATPLYRDSPEAKVFNSLVRDAVRAIVEKLPAGRSLRVLEIGGGTGGTTAWLLPILPPDRTQYTFTDVGPLLVAQAREQFGKYPFADFRTYDAEQPADAQGFDAGAYDIIIASNVIHATSDLRRTLGAVKNLLVPGGVLLMSEVSGYERWIDITFGLTEGWWRFTDTDLRPAYPLLTRTEWTSLLRSLGFDAYPVGSDDPRTRGMIFVARTPLAASAFEGDGTWLVLSDAGGVGTALEARLRATGQHAVVLRQTKEAETAAPLDDIRAAVAQSKNLRGIVYLWGLDAALDAESVIAAQRRTLEPLLGVVQTLGGHSFETGKTPRLFIVTRGVHAVERGRPLNVAQAPLWGMGKVVDLEHPELQATRIDLDPDAPADAATTDLLAALTRVTSEREVAVRGGRRMVPRLAAASANVDDGEPNARLVHSASGVLDDVAVQATARRAPGAGEVEIRVRAAGLNFRDVMNAVAMRDDPEPLGGECAGRVVRVGEGVEGINVGDDVVAVAEGCFARYTVAGAGLVTRLPKHMSHADGATLPLAFMTAHHALIELAGLRAGETVLIHAAAGGVGMAAIQIARRIGARIIATAGSENKRATVRAMGVGHVFNSRDTTFREDIARVTDGRGADVVLNSLAGEIIPASIDALADNGRFLEIGKREIWTHDQFAERRPAGVYHIIDLAAMRLSDPMAFRALFHVVGDEAARGHYDALPAHGFALRDGAAAFRFMAQARHMGKIVLLPASPGFEELDREGAYLVTGGLTGLGLLSARLLADAGARTLFLAGRRAPAAEAQAMIDAWRLKGVTVHTLQADISNVADVDRVFAAIEASPAPLRGVIHSAGALEDASLMQQRWERFAVPLGPKIQGTWALHEHTRHRALDFFVMYSSVASVMGSRGQANHAAANAFMDILAAHRSAIGLPAVSVSWGAWSDIGAAAERNVDTHAGSRGIGAISPEEGALAIARLAGGAIPHVVAVKVDWERFAQANAGQIRSPFFEGMRRRITARPAAGVPGAPGRAAPRARSSAFVDELTHASPVRRAELLLEFVAGHVARSVGAPDADAIDPAQPLSELGLDSLMAVELRNQLGAGLGLARSLPATLVFDYPTMQELADYLSREIVPTAAPAVATPAATDQPRAVSDLTDAQVDELFAQRLKSRKS